MSLSIFEGTELVFQPLVELSSGEVEGYEVLSRPGGDEGMDSFLERIERRGWGIDFDKYVLSRVREVLITPEVFFYRRLYVNISARSMSSKSFYLWLKHYLSNLPSDRYLCVEITEHDPISNLDACQSAIDLLRENQIPVSLDDVPSGHMTLEVAGALRGYSSLKMDREVIAEWQSGHGAHQIGRSILDLARQRQALVVVEGLDSVEKVLLASMLKISLGQGFLLGHPVSPPESPEVIAQRFQSLINS